jgi:hypothetical protein
VTATHTVTVELAEDDDGDVEVLFVRFGCTGGPEDECHQWCAEGCEEQCYGGRIILSGHLAELVAQAPLDGHRWEPMPPDGSSCRIVDWLDAGDWQDTGFNADGEEISRDQLLPGTHVIEEEWTGDDYTWSYAEPAAVPA